MKGDRTSTDEKPVGDLIVGKSPDKKFKDFKLSFGQAKSDFRALVRGCDEDVGDFR